MSGRVLVAEDDPGIQAVVSEFLRDEGLEVAVANDGAEALRLARAAPPDVAVVDVFMPVMDGRALLATWTRDQSLKGIPVVVMSAAANLKALAEEFHVQATLRKPFDLNALGSIVQSLLVES
ncbi:MAG: response regulator [Chloroflexi bacterium]|nr:response regulator [Chloroflexota bacterium]